MKKYCCTYLSIATTVCLAKLWPELTIAITVNLKSGFSSMKAAYSSGLNLSENFCSERDWAWNQRKQ